MAEPIRVLFWADAWLQIGGAERWAHRYVSALRKRGYEIEVLTAEDDYPAEDPDLHVHPIQAGTALRNGDAQAFTAAVKQTTTIQQKFRPHLVHLSTSGLAPSLTLFLMACPAGGSRVLSSLHYRLPETFLYPGCLLERTLQRSSAIACFSKATLQWMEAHWPDLKDRAALISHALPLLENEQPSAQSEVPRSVAFIGRLSREKGADLAIRTLSLLRRTFQDLQLVIAGDGPERSALRSLACDLGLAEAVSFRGWLEEREVQALLRTVSLVLVPSREESFGLVALEAARAMCPVVATDVDGLPEVCLHEQTAILCPPEDPEALCAAAGRLLSDPVAAGRMATAARAHFESFFTWEAHLDAYEELMHRILADTGEDGAAHEAGFVSEPR